MAPQLRVCEAQLFERPVNFRIPFRFGASTVREAPQAFARARMRLNDGREAWGAAAELMVPKWFDKNPALSNEENFEQLRLSLRRAVNACSGEGMPRTAFALSASHYADLVTGTGSGLNTLTASFGPAQLDKAIMDALCAEKEVSMRGRLPENVKMYSGDDFNYAELIAGDEHGFSHALLGIFDAIAPAASAALAALGRGERNAYDRILAPTVPLSRHIFKHPTRFYKTGVVFMAYLSGHQDHFTLLGGQQGARSALHLAELFRLGDKAGLLRDPELAASRVTTFMTALGVSETDGRRS